MGAIEHLRKNGYPDATTLLPEKVAEWAGWYAADNAWYSSTERGADDRTYKVERISIKPARMVCQEWASLIMNERTLLAVKDENTNKWLDRWLASSKFLDHGQDLIEKAFAFGTAAWVLQVKGLNVTGTGAVVANPAARILARRFTAREIVPLSYDEDECVECAFVSGVVVGGARYEQLQMHVLDDGEYVVRTVFLDEKGRSVALPGYLDTFRTGSAVPLFALARTGLANPYSDHSPFGVSVFDDAIGAVKLTDQAVDNMHRDLWLGQKMVFLDERMLERDSDNRVVVPRAKDQQLFRKAEMDAGNNLIEEYNPDLRVADNRMALATALELLGQRTGLGSDYFALDEQGGVKTATEVVAEDSDLFRSLRKHENALAPALKDIVLAVLSLARTVVGEAIPEDVGEVTVTFDDSVIEDTNAQRERDRKDVAAALMQPFEYRMRWYGEDEETARAAVGSGELPPEE